jgi:hypothetical protein
MNTVGSENDEESEKFKVINNKYLCERCRSPNIISIVSDYRLDERSSIPSRGNGFFL